MIVDFWYDGQRCDLSSGTKITHTFQVNDIADVKDRQASHTNQFDLPKTARNKRIMQGLGLTSDTSLIPYNKPNCQIKLDGFDLIVKGWANVTETTEVFKVYVYSGIINFFKAIENKTLGDLGADFFSKLNHTKNTDAVIASFTNEYYRYFVADFNGKTLTSSGALNVDHMIAFARAKYIFESIHTLNGYTFDGSIFSDENYTKLWISNSKFSDFFANSDVYFTGNSQKFTIEAGNYSGGFPFSAYYFVSISDGYTMKAGQLRDYGDRTFFKSKRGWYVVPDTSKYKIEIAGGIRGQNKNTSIEIRLSLNTVGMGGRDAFNTGTSLGVGKSDISVNYTTTVQLNAGDSITVTARLIDSGSPGNAGAVGYEVDSDLSIKITKVTDETVSFTDAISDMKQTDFVKEIYNRFGLTVFPSEFNSNLHYDLVSERFNAPVIDWSAKYITRISEAYVYSDYAQQNVFAYKYSDENLSFNNGNIAIENKNLPDSKTVFQSTSYSAESNISPVNIGTAGTVNVPVLKMYDKEPKDDGKGNISIDYKGLDKRFFFIKESDYQTTINIGSDILNTYKSYKGSLPVAVFQKWDELLNLYYRDFTKILNRARIHNIELYLNSVDALQLDFRRLYFFRQEQQYYILNKLSVSEDKATGEFVRVTKTEQINPDLQITWEDGTTDMKSGSGTSVKILTKSASAGVPRVWGAQSTGVDYHIITPNGELFPLAAGVNAFVLRQTINGKEYISNVLYYNNGSSGTTTETGLSNTKYNPVNLCDNSVYNSDVCYFGNQYTKTGVMINTAIPQIGTLIMNKGGTPFTGIYFARFASAADYSTLDSIVWNVDPQTGRITGKSTITCN